MSGKLEIIMFNMSGYSEWQKGIANRNYHLFRKLLENDAVGRIICVDFLPFTFKRAIRNYWQNIFKGEKGEVIFRDLTTRVIRIPHSQTEVYVFSTIDSIFSSAMVIKKINKVLSKIFQLSNYPTTRLPRVIWSCFPMFVDYFSAKGGSASGGENLLHDLTVFDAVDNWIEHPSFIKQKEKLNKNYQIIAGKSDLIFTVSENLLGFFKNFGREKDIYWIANGVDVVHFMEKSTTKPEDLKNIPRPIIGYVGIIQQRLDIDLLEYLAEKNPEKSFVLIGPLWPVYFQKIRKPAIEIQRLKKYKNIYLLGQKNYLQTPDYIKNFDLAISPHRLNNFVKYTNSLKVLEYLACGQPVVSTPPSGVERFSHLVYIAQDYQDFNKKMEMALRENNEELKNQRISQMKNQDWSFKIEEMIKLIKEKLL